METLGQPHAPSVTISKPKFISAINEFLDDLETNRFGFAPMILVAMACLGGVAAAFAVQKSEIELLSVAVTTAFIEMLVIAVAPMRLIALATAIAFLVDLFVFIF
jgi:hypothetical protein